MSLNGFVPIPEHWLRSTSTMIVTEPPLITCTKLSLSSSRGYQALQSQSQQLSNNSIRNTTLGFLDQRRNGISEEPSLPPWRQQAFPITSQRPQWYRSSIL